MRFLRVWDPEHAVKDPTWLGRGSAPPPGIAGPKVKSRTWTAPDPASRLPSRAPAQRVTMVPSRGYRRHRRAHGASAGGRP